MATNKENNIKLHGIITTFFNEVKKKLAAVKDGVFGDGTATTTQTGAANSKAEQTVINTALENTMKTYVAGLRAVKKNSLHFFPAQETTGPYANRTLFSELAIPKGYAILGGTGGTHTTGEIKSHTHTQAGHSHNASQTGHSHQIATSNDGGKRYYTMKNSRNFRTSGAQDNQATNGSVPIVSTDGQAGDIDYMEKTTPAITVGTSTPAINSTGGAANKAEGLEIVAYVYTALKDITNGEME